MVHAFAAAPPTDGSVAGLSEYGAVLGQVLDPEGYPELTAAVAGNAFGTASEWIDDADFTFGLDLLLDGIQALMDRGPGWSRYRSTPTSGRDSWMDWRHDVVRRAGDEQQRRPADHGPVPPQHLAWFVPYTGFVRMEGAAPAILRLCGATGSF